MEQIRTIGDYFDILSQSQKIYGRCLEPVCRKWALTRSELDVLLFLYNNPEFDRAADIVSRRGMTKSHVSMSASSLESRKLLLRQFSETDRRTAHLRLTEQARQIAQEGRAAQQRFFDSLYQGVSEEDYALWQKITHQVYQNIHRLNQELSNP